MIDGAILSQLNSFAGGIATTLAIISGLLAFLRFLKRRRERLYYTMGHFRYVRGDIPEDIKVMVSHGDKQCKRLTITLLAIVNRSPITVTDDDFTRPIHINFSRDSTYLRSLVLHQDTLADTRIQLSGDSAFIVDAHLGRGSGILIEFAHDQERLDDIVFSTKSIDPPGRKTLRSVPIITTGFVLPVLAAVALSIVSDLTGVYSYILLPLGIAPIILFYVSLSRGGRAWDYLAKMRRLSPVEAALISRRRELHRSLAINVVDYIA